MSHRGRWLAAGLVCGCACAATGRAHGGACGDADEARLLALRTIRIPVAGCVTGSFDKAYALLQATNALELIQQAYAARLPAGERPEFEVRWAGEGRYYYVNRHRERCDIRELWRASDTNTWAQAAFHVKGERYFGAFESLIYLTVRREPASQPERLAYDTEVRVWPHGAVVRAVLRYMPGVERYFRKKTAEMRGIMTGVFDRLAGPGAG